MENSDRSDSAKCLTRWVREARARTLDLVADLDDDQIIGPKIPTSNPLLWEIGHVAWFQEHWVLRHIGGHKPILANGDDLYDSITISHDVRWDLPLLSRDRTLTYISQVRDNVLELLDHERLTERAVYFAKLSVFHEDMHTESFTYARQTLAYPAPTFVTSSSPLRCQRCDASSVVTDRAVGDVEISGGTFHLGAIKEASFVFDNEKWIHPVTIEPFAIARTAVTQSQFAEFVDDDGYQRRQLWSDDGWQWREETGATHPLHWKSDGNGKWRRRHFDQWQPVEPDFPVIHVNWYEADAYCRWAGRRLPSEAEWERAAAGSHKRHYPWGDSAPSPERANLDWQAMGPVDVAAHEAGESTGGCRQMLGNLWEWTATTCRPYPGFVADPYQAYTQTSFGKCKILRGGCWATRSRLLRNTWRNFYQPDRRDVFAGFRTCAP